MKAVNRGEGFLTLLKKRNFLYIWLAQLISRSHRNVAAVALANKLARMAWAVLAKNEPYRPPVLADVAAA